MIKYKCIKPFIYAQYHEAFELGQIIEEWLYDQLSDKGKENFIKID